MKRHSQTCGADTPGRHGKEPIKRILRWMVYRKPDGLFGISVVGWVVLTILAVAVMGIVALITALTV